VVVSSLPADWNDSPGIEARSPMSPVSIVMLSTTPIFLRGDHPVVYDRRESDNPDANYRRYQPGYSTVIRVIK